jgi:serine/threonine protein kinase
MMSIDTVVVLSLCNVEYPEPCTMTPHALKMMSVCLRVYNNNSGGDMDRFQPYSRCKEKYLKKLRRADERGLPYSFNNLTATEKISWARKMAEAVAVLHNYKGGTIVHGDIALRQFLIDKTDQSVKLVSSFES